MSTVHVTSIDRECTTKAVTRAGDGCCCIFTMSTNHALYMPICLSCSRSRDDCSHNPIPLDGDSNSYCLVIGQAPDLMCDTTEMHVNLRRLLEDALTGSRPSDVIRISGSLTSATSQDAVSELQLTIHVNNVIHPPFCVHHPPGPEETGDDPRERLTSDWNPELATFWHYRASGLKRRGNWIVQSHPTAPWSCAFACYARSYQLATLARRAMENCVATEEHPRETTSLQCLLNPRLVYPDVIDLDRLTDCDQQPPEKNLEVLLRLEFSLLLNLALCQLKSNCPEATVRLCTQAISIYETHCLIPGNQMYNGSDKALPPEVGKSLYRRAQGYMACGKYDEAIPDLQQAMASYEKDGKDSMVACCKKLLDKAQYKLSQEDAVLMERLRRNKDMFH